MKCKRSQTSQDKPIYFKNRYIIVFYAADDDTFVASFDNIWEICRYKNLEVNQNNIQNLRNEVYKAMTRENHTTRMLNGQLNYMYLVDMIEE